MNALLTGLNFPVSLRFAPDGRIFYTEKDTGIIRIIQQNGTLLPTPFATVNPIFNTGEAGLLGIALDPAFSSNNYAYVYYTYRDGQFYTHGHIVRYTASGNTGTSPKDIFDVTSSAPNTVYHSRPAGSEPELDDWENAPDESGRLSPERQSDSWKLRLCVGNTEQFRVRL